jgi:hypothetical protein
MGSEIRARVDSNSAGRKKSYGRTSGGVSSNINGFETGAPGHPNQGFGQDGAAKSAMRLQLGNLKKKAKELEDQVSEKDAEI